MNVDKITLQNMRFQSKSGVLPEEKEKSQEFIVTLELSVSEIPACLTDCLDDTVNYAEVFELARAAVEDESCDLIEYMAAKIILRVMRSFPIIDEITCEIKKPHAPIEGNFDSMNVCITRTRAQLETLL